MSNGHLPPGQLPGGSSSSSSSTASDYGIVADILAPIDYQKTVNEVIKLTFNWAAKLDGDTISSVSYSFPDGLTEGTSAGTTSARTVIASGGTAGRVYRVIGQIVTAGGQTFEMTKRVMVIE